MRIGICGSISVGKTTLVKEISKLDQFKDYFIATERSKYLMDLGIPLNTDSTVKGQFVFMAERASELIKEDLITDRTIWDVCSFTMSSNTISWTDKQKLVEAASTLMKYYDIVFYCDPEGVDIEDNGVRTIDPIYREKIDYTIKQLLEEYQPNKLINLKGSTPERIKIILEYLNIYNMKQT